MEVFYYLLWIRGIVISEGSLHVICAGHVRSTYKVGYWCFIAPALRLLVQSSCDRCRVFEIDPNTANLGLAHLGPLIFPRTDMDSRVLAKANERATTNTHDIVIQTNSSTPR